MGDLQPIDHLLSVFVGRVEGKVHGIVVEFDHVLVGEDLDRLGNHLLHSHPVVAELELDWSLVVSEVHLEGSALPNLGSLAGSECRHRVVLNIIDDTTAVLQLIRSIIQCKGKYRSLHDLTLQLQPEQSM